MNKMGTVSISHNQISRSLLTLPQRCKEINLDLRNRKEFTKVSLKTTERKKQKTRFMQFSQFSRARSLQCLIIKNQVQFPETVKK